MTADEASGSDSPVTCVVIGVPPSSVPSRALQAVAGATFVSLADATPAQCADATVALVWDFRWSGLAGLLDASPRLRWVHAGSAGVDHLLPALAGRTDIVLTNSAGVFERPIAEYVLGLMLWHAKGFDETALAQSERRWAYRETASLDGATLVVVGAGRIGTAIARLATAMGMQVIGVRRTAPDGPAPAMFARVVGVADLVTVAGEADFVAIATPATPATDRLVDARVLASMKPTAFLMNVGRATAVDTVALTAALRDAVIAGAALDVFDEEPLPPDSPLWAVQNLLVSPHMSGDAGAWGSRIIERFAANLAAWRKGLPLESIVDRGRGY